MTSVVAISSIFCGKKSYVDMLQNSSGDIAFMCRMKGVTQDVIAITANELFPDAIQCVYKDGLFFPQHQRTADHHLHNKSEAYKCSIWLLYMKLYIGDAVSFDLCSGCNQCFDMRSD